MGMDYHSLDAYGGFEEMYSGVTGEAPIFGSARIDFATALCEVLEGKKAVDALPWRGDDDRVAEEIQAGVDALKLSCEERQELVKRVRGKLFRPEPKRQR